ncbi:MFS transporter [Dictyobacter formicarum]|uniref:Nitrate transporter n=1 Tax=Dictyobacter formicarum TaxID=2778368 RepID=A0ABQ3VCX1_9CHLR|nr:MFS transporter [Dictyobacter formicarum]GHO84005.1 nitrate transporter [Dictyobacter formicarum]
MPFMSSRDGIQTSAKLTVLASFLHFDMCFTIWVLLGSLSVPISQSLGLNPFLQTVMVAIPTLSGSLMRIPMGLLGDRFGGRRVGVLMLLFLFVPLLLGWLVNINFPAVLCIGLMLGVGGSSFAVALPMASYWYPPSKQGLIMGISAAGNMGVVFANLLAPSLARTYGWHAVLGITMLPLALVLLAFSLFARDCPSRPQPHGVAKYLIVLNTSDLWWFCLLYCVTFGGFVGLGTFLPQFFHNQYGISAVNAGYLTALATFMGSTFRPLGGYIADKLGGVRILTGVLLLVVGAYALSAFLFPLPLMVPLVVLGVMFLSMGNGAVFQLIPQRFQTEIGIITGIVGAFGGFGGFILPLILGSFKQMSGSYTFGWIVLAGVALLALVMLRILVLCQQGWRTRWSSSFNVPEQALVELPEPEYQM